MEKMLDRLIFRHLECPLITKLLIFKGTLIWFHSQQFHCSMMVFEETERLKIISLKIFLSKYQSIILICTYKKTTYY